MEVQVKCNVHSRSLKLPSIILSIASYFFNIILILINQSKYYIKYQLFLCLRPSYILANYMMHHCGLYTGISALLFWILFSCSKYRDEFCCSCRSWRGDRNSCHNLGSYCICTLYIKKEKDVKRYAFLYHLSCVIIFNKWDIHHYKLAIHICWLDILWWFV